MKYNVHSSTNPYLDQVKAHTEPYTTDVLGHEIIVYPDVMSPKYDWSPRFHVQNMPNQKGKSFLEIGCGSGILSTFAALQGATSIFAVDINPNAIANTKANLEKYNVKEFQVIESDVFQNVSGKYDTINFAAPYHGNEPKEILEYGVSDPGYRALRLFMKEASTHLNPGGQVVLGFSNTGDTNLLNELIIENKFLIKDFKEEENDGWKAYLYVLEPIVFKNELQNFIYEDDYEWFKIYKDHILNKKVLKVGYGLGYSSYFIKIYNNDIVNIDIEANSNSINSGDLKLYNGLEIPFPDKSFDVVICTYTLHHTLNTKHVLQEILRVSKSEIIIVEETYKNIFEKTCEVFNCWRVNMFAGQKVKIFWNSYFSSRTIRDVFQNLNLSIISEITKPRKNFFVELFILRRK